MYRRTLTLSARGVLTALLLLAGREAAPASPHVHLTPGFINAAVDDKARPEADTRRDADRHPGLTLDFAGVRPALQVAELAPGGGYYTRLLSAVVGNKGKVYAIVPPRRPEAPADQPDPAARLKPITGDSHYGNVSVQVQNYRELELPRGLDLVWTSLNYHDFHNVDGLKVVDLDKAVLKALKPGGIFIVIDHAAAAGSGVRDTSTLHRIDPALVRKEVTSVGFRLAAASELLRNEADPHTAAVLDPGIRGHTDQFILKFVKPKG
jgi:predicted methyltransferase